MLDEKKLNEFLGKFMDDVAAALNGLLVDVGDKLGLYRAMAEAGEGGLTPERLASKTGTNPRMIGEWLAAQAANGYVTYDPGTGAFSLPEEHALVLAHENSPVFLQGAVQTTASLYLDEAKVIRAMRTGKGLGWGDHEPGFHEGQERLSRPLFSNLLVQSWIPALDGVEAKLRGGAKVAEVGSGRGAALIQLAKNYPQSTFVGFDSDGPSVDHARRLAGQDGALENLRFEKADASSYPADDYDLIGFISSLHDMRDPEGALAHAHACLREKGGTLMVAEAPAGDALEQNFNPVGRLLYPVSALECVPASLNEDGTGLGTLMGESRLRALVASSGFKGFRRVDGTPLLNVYEARA